MKKEKIFIRIPIELKKIVNIFLYKKVTQFLQVNSLLKNIISLKEIALYQFRRHNQIILALVRFQI